MNSSAEKLARPSLLDAFSRYEHFSRAMLDAFVLVEQSGQIVKANQLFAQLTGRTTKQILRANSFDDLLELSINGEPMQIEKLLNVTQPTRMDEVSGKTASKDDLNLILGIYPFVDTPSGEHLGSFILIRDVTAETNLQDKYKHTALKSITDQLTGLYTRSYFEEYFELQLKAVRQLPESAEQRNISIVIIDIDHFKQVNDTYGHQAGDHVLKQLAQVMMQTFRKTDILCRYGGEEFLVILPTTNLENATVPVEKLRIAIQNHTFEFEGKKIPITISSGIGQILIGSQETYEQTIARADAALYFSKREGRNRVSLHNGSKIEKLRLPAAF